MFSCSELNHRILCDRFKCLNSLDQMVISSLFSESVVEEVVLSIIAICTVQL